MEKLDGLEVEMFCEKLLPFTVAQAEAGVAALLASDRRHFRPNVATLLKAIIDKTGRGRDTIGRSEAPKMRVVGQPGVCVVCSNAGRLHEFCLPTGVNFQAHHACYEAIRTGGVPMPVELLRGYRPPATTVADTTPTSAAVAPQPPEATTVPPPVQDPPPAAADDEFVL
jgi:hypothetical protein